MTLSTEALDPLDVSSPSERVIVEFVRRLDLGDPSSVADLLMSDGVWEWPRGDRRVEGA